MPSPILKIKDDSSRNSYRWMRAILLKVPIHGIGTYNSIALTHPHLDLYFLWHETKILLA